MCRKARFNTNGILVASAGDPAPVQLALDDRSDNISLPPPRSGRYERQRKFFAAAFRPERGADGKRKRRPAMTTKWGTWSFCGARFRLRTSTTSRSAISGRGGSSEQGASPHLVFPFTAFHSFSPPPPNLGGRVQSWKKRYLSLCLSRGNRFGLTVVCRYFILQPTRTAEEPGMLYYFERLPFKNANVQPAACPATPPPKADMLIHPAMAQTPAEGSAGDARGGLGGRERSAGQASLLRSLHHCPQILVPGQHHPVRMFLICHSRRKQCLTRVPLQASNADEKAEWVQAFAAFVLENLSTSVEKVEITSHRLNRRY